MIAVVTGMIATYPMGGVAWDYGQYALGLERLGWDVYYLEDTGYPAYDPETHMYDYGGSYGARFLKGFLAEHSPHLGDRWHVRAADGQMHGIPANDMAQIVADADLFLNVSGGCVLREAYLPCQHKALIDTDPGWNHFFIFPRQDAQGAGDGCRTFRAHDHFFTYATRLGQPDCPLPDFGLTWRTTLPPVVLDAWQPLPPGERWTTVMSWNNYPEPLRHGETTYGGKEREFPQIETLPAQVSASLEVAVGGVNPPRQRWESLGWSVLDSHAVSTTGDVYRDYIQESRGELSIAKNVYGATRSGWFSCRSVCYLAAGRPVVVQDTGFSERIPTGQGLLAFSTGDEAAQAINAVERDYETHQKAARQIAQERFDADRVLGELLADIGLG